MDGGGDTRLLAHRALVGIPWALVVVRVRYEPSAYAQDRERVYLHVCVPPAARPVP